MGRQRTDKSTVVMDCHCHQNNYNFILSLRKQDKNNMVCVNRGGMRLDIDWLINQQLRVEHHFCVNNAIFNYTHVLVVTFL